MMFDRVLIANRGEIAVRIARTCRRLGIATVAIASDPDLVEPHARAADEVVRIGPAPASASYLDIDRIIEVALDRGVDAIHPGYGFLSEAPAFAEAVRDAGITFVGPSAEVIRLMGDKGAAKRHLGSAGVPLIPGTSDDALDDDALIAAAQDLGAPLLVKAVAGGGGKGMREVTDLDRLPAAIAAARREAKAGFGDDRLMLERLVTEPRHIEVQVLADQHGTVLHLLERECSIQRRHQKVVEECPSPVVDEALRDRLGDAAVTAARTVGYEGAGTVEFLLDAATLDDDEPTFAFLEMNTRLQVEHPVTELVTGLDLVEQQLRVAAGEPLAFGQDDIAADGHAIEVRLYAEDPVSHLPQTGSVDEVVWPTARWTRIDSGIASGSQVSAHYDPMLAKLCVHGTDRNQACARLASALAHTAVFGVITNLELLRAIAATDAFRSGEMTTGFLTDHLGDWHPAAVDAEVVDAAAVALARDRLVAGGGADDPGRTRDRDVFAELGPFRPGGVGGWPLRLLESDDQEHVRHVRTTAGGDVEVEHDNTRHQVPAGNDLGGVLTRVDHRNGKVWVHDGSVTRGLRIAAAARHADLAAAGGAAAFTAPMPGSVLEVAVSPGQQVTAGTTLVVVEAMKMEHPITAPSDGEVTGVHVRAGERVDAGASLVSFTATADGSDSAGSPPAAATS
jgi:acetyl-CoA/propionyl-CoA carboxylase, biotin carboxylase, biotin carboxyl carrier protein